MDCREEDKIDKALREVTRKYCTGVMTVITSLSIENFRGIKSLKLKDLGQINVIAGKNNSCKSSVLEALALALGANDGPKILEASLREILIWRGWYGEQAANDLFYGYSDSFGISIGKEGNMGKERVEIIGYNSTCIAELERYLERYKKKSSKLPLFFSLKDEEEPFIHVKGKHVSLGKDYDYFSIRTNYKDEGYVSSIKKSSVISKDTISEMMLSSVFYPETSFEFLTPLTLRKANYVETLYSYAYERRIINRAIKSLELAYPDIKNFSPLLKYNKWILYVETSHGVYPYYVMGEGFKNILLISLLIALRKNGYLLIDSAEAFHHPKSLRIMAQSLIKGAKENNVQVFLTTHSLELIDMLIEYGLDEGIDGRIVYMKREGEKLSAKMEPFERAKDFREVLGLDLRG